MLLMFLLISKGVAYSGYLQYFPPYDEQNKPRVGCKIQRINSLDSRNYVSGDFLFQLETKKNSITSWDLVITIKKKKGNILLNKALGRVGWSAHNAKVYWSYLNKDHKKDYIIVTNSRDEYNLVFLLSKKDSFSLVKISTLDFSPDLFYDYNKDKRCEFLKMDLKGGSYLKRPSKKVAKLLKKSGFIGEFYSPQFIVYNIVSFSSKNKLATYNNKLSKYFPKWIEAKTELYEYGTTIYQLGIDQDGHLPNTKTASFLTEKDKKLIWKSQEKVFGKELLGYPWQ